MNRQFWTAESVIKVHHSRVMVSGMNANQTTLLEDFSCLCANCHRAEHSEMRRVREEF